MKIVFAGTPAFSVPALRALNQAFGVSYVVTQPDKRQGRKGILTPPPVKEEALSIGLPVFQPESLLKDASCLVENRAELMITCAYGQILPQNVLDLFPRGVYNVHASLLPAYRGAAPIARAIMDGCEKTGITIMKTELGLDTGDILLQRELQISNDDTAQSLGERLARLGAECICDAVMRIRKGDVSLIPQGEGFVCKKVMRTCVDFSRSAREVCCLIRGLSPAPLCYGTLGGLFINFYFAKEVPCEKEVPFGTVVSASPSEGLTVKCGTGAVKITELQAAGGKRMSARDFLNGRKIKEGDRFEVESLL